MLTDSKALVTGATGLLGSHIAERLIARGRPVRALVRPGSDTRFLESIGVEIVRGDLTNPDDCFQAVQGVGLLFHSAAKVGDWGAWKEFQTACMDATENLATAAQAAGVRRFVHISSTSAYGHPRGSGVPIDESHPLGVGIWWPWDYYTRSKVDCEQILWQLAEQQSLPLTILRPSWLYGERDRTTVARLVGRLRRGGIPLIGRGDNPLSAIYAGNVADAAILAADDPNSVGEAYNITDQGRITQREFLDLFAEACGAPPAKQRLPYAPVFASGFLLEAAGRLTGRQKPPLITRYATWLMGRTLTYSTAKARQRLGWVPALGYRESIERAVRWYLEESKTASDESWNPRVEADC
ncbi:NAD-dependent epimerase/dehydratase family protein [soil metagenome]